MNESQIIAWLHTYVYAAPEVQLEMIREMAQRFGGLRRDLATRNEEIGQLRDEYQKLMVHWAGAVQLQDEYKAQVAELERTLSRSRADNGKLLEDHGVALARIAELEAQLQGCLVQVDEDEDLHCRFDSEGITVKTMYSGTAFLLHGYAGDIVHLPAGYYIAKARPSADA